MQTKPEALYLELMKKTLMFLLWPQPPVPVTMFNLHRSPVKRFAMASLSGVVEKFGYRLMQPWEHSMADRLNGTAWPIWAHTMIGMKRLNNLQECVETVLRDGVEGDLIETGVWRGGSTIFMKAILTAHGDENRKIFVADSFKGLPPPDTDKHPDDLGDNLHEYSYLAVSKEQVEENFRSYGLLDDRIVFLKGWFEDTLPTAPIEKLAILRLDGDMYGSTITALENLYPKLSVGGFCIVDDYILPNCKKAVSDYCSKIGIDPEIKDIDGTGAFWRKGG